MPYDPSVFPGEFDDPIGARRRLRTCDQCGRRGWNLLDTCDDCLWEMKEASKTEEE